MNKEILQIIAMAAGGILFALGGTQITPTIKGQKWLRRWLLPLVLSVVGLFSGYFWLWVVCYGLSSIIAFHLPYGEETPYWGKFLSGCCFFLPVLWLAFTPWVLVGPLAWIILFLLSNKKPFDKWVPWKCVEFITGALVGITLATILK